MKIITQHITCLLILLVTLASPLRAQVKDLPAGPGSISGAAWDSAHNYAIQDATVAIYRKSDAGLVQFCVTDQFGAFRLQRLPLNVPLQLMMTFAGFELYARSFTLTAGDSAIHLGKLLVSKSDRQLKEVVVNAVVPVRINNDTIEFNARAFNLDSNAVVEDLMRQLPGMTVWGDGSITLNGRQIKSLTVNGKPFFGESFKIATQNIPKTAVNKVQVFNEVNREDPLDTLTKMNIKLMEGQNLGYFGKVSAGGGTGNRYQLEGIMSFFNAKNQLSVGGTYNNINKVAGNMTTLLENTAFKGLSASIDYQPDFRQEGINESYVLGARYKHTLKEKNGYGYNNALRADYFMQQQSVAVARQTLSRIFQNNKPALEQRRINSRSRETVANNVSTNYNFRDLSGELDITPYLRTEASRNHTSAADTSRSGNTLQSTNSAREASRTNDLAYGVKIAYTNTGAFYSMEKRNFRDFSANYAIEQFTGNEDKTINTRFASLSGDTKLQLNRQYKNRTTSTEHQAGFRYNNLNRLAGIDENKISVTISDNIKILNQQQESAVTDFDSAGHNAKTNAYLTNDSKYHRLLNDLALTVEKLLLRETLSGRYNKTARISAGLTGQSFYQKNESRHAFQDIRQSYFRPLPQASFSFSHSKFNYIQRDLKLQYNTTATYPTIAQLAPLIDSSGVWLLDMGNPYLAPSTDRKLSISFSKGYAAAKNYRYQLEVSAGMVKDRMTDSTIYNTAGNAVHYIVNADGYKYAAANGEFKKTKKIGAHQLQAAVNAAFQYAFTPEYVNNLLLYADVYQTNGNLSLLYTFRDHLAVSVQQQLSTYHTQPRNAGNSFRNTVLNTGLAATKVFTRRLTLSSDITYNRSVTSQVPPLSFYIWNAHATCRFSKKNNMEIRLSAMDLLRQNKGIINYGTATALTTGTTNVLQQYFMCTLSYYPRKFGK